jgi:D-glycero-alpha-D-manno-heptose-7-phosphate kinase
VTVIASARAPVRVDFTGGYTDIAPVSTDMASITVNAAIGRYAHVVAQGRTDGRCVIFRDGRRVVDASLQDDEPLTLDLGLTAALSLAPLGGVEIHSWLDAPSRSGLGTSGAMSVALVGALAVLKGDSLSPDELAESAAAVERSAGIAGGKQDQLASSLGGVNAFQFDPILATLATPLGEPAVQLVESCIVLHDDRGRDSQDLVAEVMRAYQTDDNGTRFTLTKLAAVGADVQAAFEQGSVATLGDAIDTVCELQACLHVAIRAAIDTSPVKKMIEDGLCWAKPLGGAGLGAAWVALPRHGKRAVLLDAVAGSSLRAWPCIRASGADVEAFDSIVKKPTA